MSLCGFPPTDHKQAPLFTSNGTFTFKLPPVTFLTGFAPTEEAKGGGVNAELSTRHGTGQSRQLDGVCGHRHQRGVCAGSGVTARLWRQAQAEGETAPPWDT